MASFGIHALKFSKAGGRIWWFCFLTFWVYCNTSSAFSIRLDSVHQWIVPAHDYLLQGNSTDLSGVFSFQHLVRSLPAELEKQQAGIHTLGTILSFLFSCNTLSLGISMVWSGVYLFSLFAFLAF